MTCAEFLDVLSDYRDGLLRDAAQITGFESHRAGCTRCARLLAALDVGLGALRHQADEPPSHRFRTGLEDRLKAEVALGDPVMPTHAGLAAAFLLAAAVGLLLYEGLARPAAEPLVAQRAGGGFADVRVAEPALVDVTLPAFTHSSLDFHSGQPPLGTLVAFTR